MEIKDFTFPPPSRQAQREVQRDSALRRCRTCYGHLAGVAGIELFKAMTSQGWLELAEDPAAFHPELRLTRLGLEALAERSVLGLNRGTGKGKFAFGCTDWTERRFHLGGFLGRVIANALAEQGFVERREGTRVVRQLLPIDGWVDRDFRPCAQHRITID